MSEQEKSTGIGKSSYQTETRVSQNIIDRNGVYFHPFVEASTQVVATAALQKEVEAELEIEDEDDDDEKIEKLLKEENDRAVKAALDGVEENGNQ